jgi:alcohol dehydrogenase class IV
VFDFYLNTQIKFGAGSRSSLSGIIAKEHWSFVGLVIDHNIAGLDIISDLIEQLKKQVDKVVIGKCSISEPTYDSVEELRNDFCHPSLEAVIALGGGSTLDMAKAMAVLVNNKEPAIEYRGFNKMTAPVLPVIAIPTTAGTGSEVTPNASFIDAKEKKKMGINGDAVRPRYAILDPELTLSCPRNPTISAAVDSIVHAVEAFAAKKTNHLARLFSKEGFKRVFKALPELVNNLDNLDLRCEVMYGAFLSGVALMHSGTGPAAAMSYPMGVHYGVPHGIGGGIFLPHVIRHNVKNRYYDYAELYDLIVKDAKPKNREEKSIKFVEKLNSLWETLSIPGKLDQLNLEKEMASTFINETMELKGALDQNPVPFYENEIRQVLEALEAK